MGIPGAEGHVVADHHHCRAGGGQRGKNSGKGLLEGGVQALGRLVQQQDIRLVQQHLTQGGPLLLAAGEVIGMTVQQLGQAAKGRHLFYPAVTLVFGEVRAVKGFVQVLTDRVFHEQGLRVLGQNADAARMGHGAPLGRQRTGQQAQGGGLARAVTAQQRQQLTPAGLKVQTADHVRLVRLIAEPETRAGKGGIPGGIHRRGRQRAQGVFIAPAGQEIAALADGDGAGRVAVHPGPDTDGGGHGQEHIVAAAPQGTAHRLRRAGTEEMAAVQHGGVGGQGQCLLETVLRQEDGDAQLAVQAAHGLQKVGGGNGVQLAGGLVQYQQTGLEHHDRGQGQQLLLAAGELVHFPMEPVLDAEEGGHLCHAATDGGRVAAKALQSEGQLMPDLVGDGLLLRGLKDEADIGGLLMGRQVIQRLTVEEDTALGRTVGAQGGLQLAEKRGLAAAGGAAEDPELALTDREGHIRQRGAGLLGIGKTKMLQTQQFRHGESLLSGRDSGAGTGRPAAPA